jgi:UPF0755 protein
VEQTIEIKKGDNWKTVAKKLKENELISNEKFFYYMIREKHLGRKLKTGEFAFKGILTPFEIAKIIVKGKVKLYSFTIPEGFNKYDTANYLKKIKWIKNSDKFLQICDSRKFLKSIGESEALSCEGLLFPSTYKFPKNVSIQKVMKKMDMQMQNVLSKYEAKIKKYKLHRFQILILASLIEKETGAREEQPKIASVFLNRLKKGMKLQTDPTVIYGLLPNFNGNITKKNLLTDHPFNTYTRKGLPIGPICFPSENAIKSVLYPAKTNYLYFVSTNKGHHYFSKSLKEHNAAVQYYQIERKRGQFHWNKD